MWDRKWAAGRILWMCRYQNSEKTGGNPDFTTKKTSTAEKVSRTTIFTTTAESESNS
jgi:hypothetical protein